LRAMVDDAGKGVHAPLATNEKEDNGDEGRGGFAREVSRPVSEGTAVDAAPQEDLRRQVSTVSSKRLVGQKKELLRGKHEHYAATTANKLATVDEVREISNWEGLRNIVLHDPLSLLLLLWPLGCASHYLEWGLPVCFWMNFAAMIPLAKILGDATEELAAGLKNDTVGGLLNATFGNAVEMILTVQTLRAGHCDVVKGTLLGSVLSNLLLVLGMSFFLGGLKAKTIFGAEQEFSKEAALTNMTMLLLATTAFALPTVFFVDIEDALGKDQGGLVLEISRWCSIYILLAYVAFLIFQLYTHIDVFAGQGGDDEEEEAHLTPTFACGLLFVTTCFVAASSEWLVASIDGLVDEWRISKAFIGIILLPIVGNACEHAGAVRMAIANKVDITIGIAVGSSTQIALFVVPCSVLIGWVIDEPMDLNFGSLYTTVMVFAVLIAFSIITDGASNWLEGFMLMVAYMIVATLFWFCPDELDRKIS
jgi:Ca2+:H+ antiporter